MGNLLGMSRLQTRTVTPLIRETDLDEVVPMALGGVPEDSVVPDIPETLKYSPPGEKVLVSASALADRVEVRVADRGPGVPDEAKDRIFVPFQRYGDSPRGVGAGLGLAVARGRTGAVGGTLHAEDTPGGGLTMVLAVRTAPERRREQPEPRTTATS